MLGFHKGKLYCVEEFVNFAKECINYQNCAFKSICSYTTCLYVNISCYCTASTGVLFVLLYIFVLKYIGSSSKTCIWLHGLACIWSISYIKKKIFCKYTCINHNYDYHWELELKICFIFSTAASPVHFDQTNQYLRIWTFREEPNTSKYGCLPGPL